jgi:hypothetical protein
MENSGSFCAKGLQLFILLPPKHPFFYPTDTIILLLPIPPIDGVLSIAHDWAIAKKIIVEKS